MLDPINKKSSFIEVLFTDQNSELLEIESNVSLTLTIGMTF